MLNAYLQRDYKVVNGKNSSTLFHIVKLNGKRRKFAEGSISSDGLAFGCHLYGLFDTSPMNKSIIEYLARKKKMKVMMHNMGAIEFWNNRIERFSSIVKDNTDVEEIKKLVES